MTVDNARFVFGPANGTNLVISTTGDFRPVSTGFNEVVYDADDQPLDSGAIQVTLNGVEFTTANGLRSRARTSHAPWFWAGCGPIRPITPSVVRFRG